MLRHECLAPAGDADRRPLIRADREHGGPVVTEVDRLGHAARARAGGRRGAPSITASTESARPREELRCHGSRPCRRCRPDPAAHREIVDQRRSTVDVLHWWRPGRPAGVRPGHRTTGDGTTGDAPGRMAASRQSGRALGQPRAPPPPAARHQHDRARAVVEQSQLGRCRRADMVDGTPRSRPSRRTALPGRILRQRKAATADSFAASHIRWNPPGTLDRHDPVRDAARPRDVRDRMTQAADRMPGRRSARGWWWAAGGIAVRRRAAVTQFGTGQHRPCRSRQPTNPADRTGHRSGTGMAQNSSCSVAAGSARAATRSNCSCRADCTIVSGLRGR